MSDTPDLGNSNRESRSGTGTPTRPPSGVATSVLGILRAILTVGALTIAVRAASAGRELVVAGVYGVGDSIDAFVIAFLLPSFAISVVAGSLSSALIPIYIRVRDHEGEIAASRLLANVLSRALLLLALVSVSLAICWPLVSPVIASGFNAQKLAATRELFYLMLPTVVFGGAVLIVSAVLNARGRFATPSLVPIATPLIVILTLAISRGTLSVAGLATATLAGSVVEAAIIVAVARRNGIVFALRWTPADQATHAVVRQYFPVLAGSVVMSGTLLVDQSMAAMLGAGAVSALSYGSKVISLLLGVASTAVGTGVLPAFSTMTASGSWSDIRRTLSIYSRWILLLSVPATVAVAWLSAPIVRVLFQRGAFTSEDTELVSQVQWALAWQIPFYMLGIVGVRLLASLKRNQIIGLIAATNLVLNVVFNLILSRFMGVTGIALSTSLVYVLSCVMIFIALDRELGRASRGSGGLAGREDHDAIP